MRAQRRSTSGQCGVTSRIRATFRRSPLGAMPFSPGPSPRALPASQRRAVGGKASLPNFMGS